MAVLLWIVLLSAGVSLSQAQESFSKLPDIYKRGVELTLHQINAHDSIMNHYLFFKSIHQAEIEIFVGYNILMSRSEIPKSPAAESFLGQKSNVKISWVPTTKRIEAGFDVKYIYHNFYLKATECKRGTENADATTCAFRNDRPRVDCVICYKISAGEINNKPKPYLNCMHRRLLSKVFTLHILHFDDGFIALPGKTIDLIITVIMMPIFPNTLPNIFKRIAHPKLKKLLKM